MLSADKTSAHTPQLNGCRSLAFHLKNSQAVFER
jgi:hypothetical protein